MFDFSKASRTTDLVYNAVEQIKPDQKDVERAFARLFSSEDGKKVLSHLQVMSFHRAHSPESSNEQLRYAEGQRAMVASILRLIDKGRKA